MAAGAVLWRRATGGTPQVALVHRPRYDDWSLPKGKLVPGEHVLAGAVREVEEETGYRVRLGRPLPTRRYVSRGQDKEVRYWVGHVCSGEFRPNSEVDRLEWLPVGPARDRLTQPRDTEVLDALTATDLDTWPLVILRHAAAVPRRDWPGPDSDRPLSAAGQAQSRALRPVLAAYLPTALVSSPARRCVDTLGPYSAGPHPAGPHRAGPHRATLTDGVWTEPYLHESEFFAAPEAAVASAVDLLSTEVAAVICTHRPVLPALLTGLDLPPPAPPLRTAEILVLHRVPHTPHQMRGRVVATERHPT